MDQASSSCCQIDRCAAKPLPMAPVLDGAYMRSPEQVRTSRDFASNNQILESVLRQEATIREFIKDQSSLRALMQQQHEILCGKMEDVASRFNMPGSLLPFENQLTPVPSAAGPDNKPEAKLSEKPLNVNETLAKAKAIKRSASASKDTGKNGPISEVEQVEKELHWLMLFLRHLVLDWKFDIAMCGVILVNMLVMSAQLQWKGYNTAVHLGIRSDDNGWSDAEVTFDVAEIIFNLVYFIELSIRLVALGRSFFRNYFNSIDALIVLVTCSEVVLHRAAEVSMINLSSVRVMRCFRIFRMHRVMRLTEELGEMRVLIQTLIVSIRGLIWSVFLIMGIVLAAALIMVQLSHSFFDDEAVAIERRQWLYLMFGTTARAFYTMFECTFSSNWRNYSRPIIEDVHVGFAFFFLPYTVYVNFAVMRVIAALFLKQTMAVAALDEERIAIEKRKEKELVAQALREMFEAADSDQNGAISREEFDEMLHTEAVVEFFENLNLEIEEVIALFGVLCADDGEADYEEFLDGALKMKSPARAIDTVQIMHQQLQMHKTMEGITQALGALGIKQPKTISRENSGRKTSASPR